MTATESAYAGTEKLLYKLVHTFQQKYGGDWVELLAEANYHWQRAHLSHDPAIGKYSKRIVHQIWYGLFETFRTRTRRNGLLPRTELQDLSARPSFDLNRLLFEVSEDAGEVIRLAVEPPLDVLAEAWWRGSERKPEHLLTAISRFLREAGWTWQRITESFAEAREALQP